MYGRRIDSLRQHLAELLPDSGTVLDLGCGDGLLASLLQQVLPETHFRGMDVLVREETKIPVESFDGESVPLDDNSVDTVMIIDVLHHTETPEVLLREAKRVARNSIVIKDHTDSGFLSNSTLRFMDWVGNARHGVALPYNYLSRSQWDELFGELGLQIEAWNGKPRMYGMPADLIFGRSLHFVTRLGWA
ncbi:MAG: class I SAM-dependent methyltransferase [Pirellulaceae bacterium]